MAIVPKGSHMWRFVLAGLGTVGGLGLLFLSSFGDPVTILPDLGSAFSSDPPRPAPRLTPPQAAKPVPAPAQRQQIAQSVDPSPQRPEDSVTQQRDALKQLQELQAKLAQAAQDTAALRAQADQ